jgi:hypothetical protein
MHDFERKLEEIKAGIACMSAEEKKALARKLCGIVNETTFDMVATYHLGASPNKVMETASETLQRGFDEPPRVLN